MPMIDDAMVPLSVLALDAGSTTNKLAARLGADVLVDDLGKEDTDDR